MNNSVTLALAQVDLAVGDVAGNTRKILLGKAKRPQYINKTVKEISEYWRTRWAIPRAERYPEWYNWNAGGTVTHLRRLHATAETMSNRDAG